MSYSKKKSGKKTSTKKPYKVRNWSGYTPDLKDRGRIHIWMDAATLASWYFSGTRKRGGRIKYSDMAIELCLTIRILFHLPLRQTQGFMESIVELMGLDLAIPDYTRLSRRAKKLALKIKRFSEKAVADEDTYIIIDSTGMKVQGEGEWLHTKHGTKQRKSWRKLHLGVNQHGEIEAETLTDQHAGDPSQVSDLLDQVDTPIDIAIADGAYDTGPVYESFQAHHPEHPTQVIIPPRKTALYSEDSLFEQRNQHITYIDKRGRDTWDYASKYSRQARVENTFSRIKTIFGGKLHSRDPDCQNTEARILCNILNKMTSLGMPDSHRVA